MVEKLNLKRRKDQAAAEATSNTSNGVRGMDGGGMDTS
jgi:hypothetical protein